MSFFRKKNNIKPKNLNFQRGLSDRPVVYNPSWRNLKTKQRKGRLQKNPLISVKTPKLVISYLHLWAMKVTYKILFLVLFVGLFYFLFFSEWLTIERVLVEGNQNTDKKLILDSVEPYLHKKVLSVFPSNNFFFVREGAIKNEIIDNFRRISSVKIKKEFPDTVVLQIEEKKAVLLFCNGKGCLWVDEDGYSYNQSSYSEAVSDSSDVTIVEDTSQSDLLVGQGVTDATYVSFVNDLKNEFEKITQKQILKISTPILSAREIRVETMENWIIYLDVDSGLKRSTGLLEEVLKQIKEKEGEEKSKCLDYIDLRVRDRVFYKIKDNCGQNVENQEGENPSNGDANQNQNTAEAALENEKNEKVANENQNKDNKNENKNSKNKSDKKKN